MFDLDTIQIRADDGAFLQLRHPVTQEELTHDGQPVGIRLAGIDSKLFQKAQHEVQNRRMKRTGAKRFELSAEELEESRIFMLASVTLEFVNLSQGGQPLEANRETAARLYRDVPWIREQVDAFVGDREAFTARPSPS